MAVEEGKQMKVPIQENNSVMNLVLTHQQHTAHRITNGLTATMHLLQTEHTQQLVVLTSASHTVSLDSISLEGTL